MAIFRVAALAQALNWSLAEMQAATGVDLGAPTPSPSGVTMTQEWTKSGGATQPSVRLQLLESAGLDLFADERYIMGYVEVEPALAREGALHFSTPDDSMAPAVPAGDVLHVDPTELQPRDGQLYVLRAGETAYLRRARQYPSGHLSFLTDSNTAPPIAAESALVIGRVFGISPKTRIL